MALFAACICTSTTAAAQDLDGGPARTEADSGVPSEPPSEVDSDVPTEAPPSEGAPDSRAAPAESEPEEESPAALTPPHIVRAVPPEYPAARLSGLAHPTVVVIVTLDAEGRVADAQVEHGAGEDFDDAALRAVREWRFDPARRGETPTASRIRIAIHFELPSFDLPTSEAEHIGPTFDARVQRPPPGRAEDAPPEVSEPTHPTPSEDEAPEVGVTARVESETRVEDRGAGSFEIDRDILAAAPRREGADMLLSVPGVFAARAEGLAIGHRINLRGFDAEHGQDVELRVGGLPVNLPSHIHGQGYADVGFLIPDVVQRVRATEGVYDPRQSDFAVAGTIDFDLGVARAERGFRAASSYGAFNTFQQLLLWAPESEREATFGAVQYEHTEGFGQRRGGDRISALVQAEARSGDWRLRGLGIVYGARADLAGVLRADDIEAGRVGFYDTYAHPTAQSQNALTGRFLGGFFGTYRADGGSNGGFSVWVGADTFRLQENFTGFIQRSRVLPGVAGRGDLIEQRNQTLSVGLSGRFRTEAWRPWEWLAARVEVGLDGRLDFLEQGQSLLARRNETWDQRVDASVFGTQGGLFADLELRLTRHLRINGGVRGALLLYEVDDRLGNFAPDFRPRDSFIMGFRRSAGGATVGPRVSAEVKPLEWLSLRAAYGQGYRSPQARTLEDGERAPFTTVQSGDLGAVFEFDRVLRVAVTGYWTELSDDVAFEPREGRLERIGASRRLGAVLYAQARPLDWLVGAVSVTYVNAELLEPPPATADNPQPPFEPGQNLPYVPPVVLRADVGVRGTLVEDVLGESLRGRLGVGYSLLSPRPLPYGGFAEPIHLFDAGGSLAWGPVDLGVSVFNLLDTRFAAYEFLFTSNWDPEAIPARLPARHLAAGAPFSLMVTLGLST
ncbi:MAG: TonB-dependent receptor [Sandaracinaceae bacterium]